MDADGDLPEGAPVEEQKVSGEGRGGVVFNETRERAPRAVYISKQDADKHKMIRGCGGCSSFTRGLGRQPHTLECRDRFRKLMADEAKVKNSDERRK